MVDETAEIFFLVLLRFFCEFLERVNGLWNEVFGFRFDELALAGFGFGVALDSLKGLLIIAEQPQWADWELLDGVALNKVAPADDSLIEPIDPFLIADPGRSPSGDADVLEEPSGLDVDVAEVGQSAAQTDSSNEEPIGAGGFLEPLDGLVANGVPHPLVCALHFAPLARVLVLGLSE